MTAPEVASAGVTLPATTASKPPLSTTATAAFILTVLTVFGYLTVKTLNPILDGPGLSQQQSSIGVIATVLGIFGLLSIVPIAGTIVLGHLGVGAPRHGKRGRLLSIAVLGVNYFLIALYFNRIIISTIAVITYPNGSNFVQDNFYWV